MITKSIHFLLDTAIFKKNGYIVKIFSNSRPVRKFYRLQSKIDDGV
ncbi:MAG: hypothetical protein LBR79_05695 [Oscillospiraceae bacterium]|nr:hypothetical protein [Oscillospiraceae bacterium]